MDAFLQQWVTQVNDHLIPLVPVIGNHDAGGYSRKAFTFEELYYYYFPFPPSPQSVSTASFRPKLETYRSHSLESMGTHLLALDSNQIYSADGSQLLWLKRILQQSRTSLFRFVTYHNPLYPAAEWRYVDEERESLRSAWLPLFDIFNVQMAFEFHTHRYKRTFPLRGGKVVKSERSGERRKRETGDINLPRISGGEKASTMGEVEGTVYIGDGCMGVDSHGHLESQPLPWYLESARSAQHFLVIDLVASTQDSVVSVMAVGVDGEVFDSSVRKQRR
jgi:hypothetical protein